MKLAFICWGDSKDTLEFQENSCKLVNDTLKSSSWQCEISRLDSLESYKKVLQDNKSNNITDLIFYFVGHGDYSQDLDYYMVLDQETQPQLEHIVSATKEKLGRQLPKMAIILDTCYSGKASARYTEKDFHKHIELLTSTDDKTSSYESIDFSGGCSMFSHFFCEAINSEKSNLSEIKEYIFDKTKKITIHNNTQNKKEVSQKPFYYEAQYRSKIKIKQNNNSIVEKLKNSMSEIVDYEELTLYTHNILKNSGIVDISNKSYDEILEWLYRDFKLQLLYMFEEIGHTELTFYINELRNELPNSDANIKNLPCYGVDIKKSQLNLLITLSSKDEDISRVAVEIWNSRGASNESLHQEIINLKNSNNPTQLTDKIFSLTENFCSDDVLLEFIVTEDLLGLDMSEWSTTPVGRGKISTKLNERYRVVFRSYERINDWDKYSKNCFAFWNNYHNNHATNHLKNTKQDISNIEDIKYAKLSNHPCVIATTKLRENYELTTTIMLESVCIALIPNEKEDEIDNLIDELLKEDGQYEVRELKEIVNSSYMASLQQKYNYTLLWENPNRLPKRYRDKNKKGA